MSSNGGLPPLMLTFRELEAVVAPVVMGDKWAKDTIGDLWRKLAPTPQSIPNTPGEKRIVAPSHLMAWLGDVLNRQGKPLDEAAQAYVRLFKTSSKLG